MTHELKTWHPYYDALMREEKTFEARKDDRNFQVGDILLLQEYLPNLESYSGNVCYRKITFILSGGSFGIEPGYVVMSIRRLSENELKELIKI
jgi:hypothetical protein